MILIDTGPCVALFDPKDSQHERCRRRLQTIKEPLFSTLPVLTETFHMLSPETHGSDRFRDFVLQGGLSVWFMDSTALQRAFELMEQYGDHPMDLADASLVAAAEMLRTRKIFTIDRNDFAVYRVKRGHRYYPFEVIS